VPVTMLRATFACGWREVRALPNTAAPPGIGKRLRDARESRDLSIEEAAWRTRIRPSLLLALEREQFDPLRSVVFVRGALHSYASYLGLDPGEIVRDYTARYEPPEPSSIERLDKEVQIAKKPPRPKWLLAAVASGIALVVAGVLGVLGSGQDRTERSLPPLPGRVQAESHRVAGPVTVRIEAVRRARITVLEEGRRVYAGTLARGSVRIFVGPRSIELNVDDGSAVLLTVDGRRLRVAAPGAYRGRFAANAPAAR
jgi:helix-turn-helix protein